MCLKGAVSGHSRRTCSRECIFLNRPGCTLASLPMCWEPADHIFAWTLPTVCKPADRIFAQTLPTVWGVSGLRNSSIRHLKPGEGSQVRIRLSVGPCKSAPPKVGIMLSRGDRRSVLLSECSGACRSMLPEAGIRLSYVRRGMVCCGVSSMHGHMMVSPAVGRNHIEKEPLKQCLKNT